MSFEEYPHNTFPPYSIGAGHLISKQAITKIYKVIPRSLIVRKIDDGYIGILCRNAGVPLENDPNFTTAVEHVGFLTKFPKFVCGIYNIHGIQFKFINKIEEERRKQCKGKRSFQYFNRYLTYSIGTLPTFSIKNWKCLTDKTVDMWIESDCKNE